MFCVLIGHYSGCHRKLRISITVPPTILFTTRGNFLVNSICHFMNVLFKNFSYFSAMSFISENSFRIPKYFHVSLSLYVSQGLYMTVWCWSISVCVAMLTSTQSMLGECKASGPDCMRRACWAAVRYNTHARVMYVLIWLLPQGGVCYLCCVMINWMRVCRKERKQEVKELK